MIAVPVTDTSQLSKYPALQNLEKQTNIPKTYAVIGAITLYFFFIVFNLGGQLLTNLAGFAIPGYYSLDALFTSSKSDDTQWLTVSCSGPPGSTCALITSLSATVLGCLLLLHVSSNASALQDRLPMLTTLLSVLESLLSVVYWFPFYYTFKFVFLLWLALPTFRYVRCTSIALVHPYPKIFFSNGAIGVPKSSSAHSWLPRSAVTLAALPPLACVLRPTRPSKRLAQQDLSTNRGRAWPSKLRVNICSAVTVRG